MKTLVKSIFTIILFVVAVLVIGWIMGFRIETYDYIVGKTTVLFLNGDVIHYWNW